MEMRLGVAETALSNRTASLWIVLLTALFAVPAMLLLLHGNYSILIALSIALVLMAVWRISKPAGIILCFCFLFLLGDIRRVVSVVIGLQGLDPLVVVGCLVTFAWVLPLFWRVALPDALSKAILALTAIMVLEVFNPRQGGLTVGLSGALFFLTPMFWFWIARRYSTAELMSVLIYSVLIPLGSIAAVLGIYQTYIGFLPWQEAWIKVAVSAGYTSLYLGSGHVRSFGFSSNSVEYGHILLMATVSVIGAAFAGRRAYLLLLPLLVTAQILASERTPILLLLVSAAVLWALQARDVRTWIPRLLLGFPLAALLLYVSVTSAGQGSASSGKATSVSLATGHVTQGFLHPFDSRYSTAGVHSALFLEGIQSGFRQPLGNGLGVVTLGAGKFGGGGDSSVAGSSEVDISDVFLTTGFVGGLIFLLIIGLGLRVAVLYLLAGERILSLPLLAILLCLLGSWIPLGQYAAGPFLWCCLGFLAQQTMPVARSVIAEG